MIQFRFDNPSQSAPENASRTSELDFLILKKVEKRTGDVASGRMGGRKGGRPGVRVVQKKQNLGFVLAFPRLYKTHRPIGVWP